MFSDHVITIAGRIITITSHDVFVTCVSVVIWLVFWAALYFSRKQIVVLKRSNGTDQVAPLFLGGLRFWATRRFQFSEGFSA